MVVDVLRSDNFVWYGIMMTGRDADGGHYMGWVREKGDNWLCFDDDNVSECKTEDIMNLSGGGDWHMAYMAFYRYKE